MSDFRIVKCKNCDAGLVELSGQKLTRCEQCGYKFSLGNKSSKRGRRRSSSIQQSEQTSIQPHMTARPSKTQTTINISKGTPDIKDIVEKLKGMKNTVSSSSQSSTKKTKVVPKKKKGFPIGTIIFWIILFNVLRNIFKM